LECGENRRFGFIWIFWSVAGRWGEIRQQLREFNSSKKKIQSDDHRRASTIEKFSGSPPGTHCPTASPFDGSDE
jgi:hypothetical protein